MRIAVLTVSDRASRGDYADWGGPAIENWLRAAVTTTHGNRAQDHCRRLRGGS